MWMYNYSPIGDCFGVASERQIAEWKNRKQPYLLYNYFGYVQKIVLKEEGPDGKPHK